MRSRAEKRLFHQYNGTVELPDQEQQSDDDPPMGEQDDNNYLDNNNSNNDTRNESHSSIHHPQTRQPDRLATLPDHVLFRVTHFLDASSLARMQQTAQRYVGPLRRNESGWKALCQREWADKITVCTVARQLSQTDAWTAMRLARQDAVTRNWITRDEFCGTTTTTTATQDNIWYFRFKQSAGEQWTGSDPWFHGRPCRRVRFLRDGTVQTLRNSEPSTSVAAQHPVALPQNDNNGNNYQVSPVPLTWRFLARPMDFPHADDAGEDGSYFIRMTVAGREVPTYVIRRWRENWGFVMESCWGLYANFPLPPMDATPHPLSRDDLLEITNETQWREAFLYNVGARALPEGSEAAGDFDRAWAGI